MKNLKKYALLVLCLPLVLTGCKRVPTLQDGKQVVAEVNGKQFAAEDLFEELKTNYGSAALVNMINTYITSQEINEEMKKSALESAKAMVNSYKAMVGSNWTTFLNENGFADEDELVEYFKDSYEQQEAIEKYIKEDVIKDEEIEKYYNEEIYGEITVRHILITPESSTDMTTDEKTKAKEEALNKAKELISQLKESSNLEEDFTALAKEKSDDTASAIDGGLISNFTNESGLVEEFFNASLKLEIGKMTEEPVETEYGYHIIYKVSQNEKPSLEDVKDKILESITSELLSDDNAYQVYWAGLREKYNLTIYDDVLKSKYNLTIKSLES